MYSRVHFSLRVYIYVYYMLKTVWFATPLGGTENTELLVVGYTFLTISEEMMPICWIC